MSETNLQNPRSGRRQYLITYSQADISKFPTRESFGKMLENEFNAGSSQVKVSHWACCKEPHEENGFHYHCCLKQTGVKKWLSIKNAITKKHDIVVNFSDHNQYIYAYRYVCKTDKDVAHSDNHPDLSEVGSPRTKASTVALREAGRKRRSTNTNAEATASRERGNQKRRHLSNLEVGDFIVANNITTVQQLFAKADARKQEGESDLANFLFSRTQKTIAELMSKSWLLKQASSEIQRDEITRIEKVRNAAENACVDGCNARGRGKFRNLMISGQTNCAKTFMLKPLKCIFDDRLFDNPANDKYAWVGADKAEVILLQDFRFSKEVITWKDLLLLLEGETVKLPAPKNHFANDVVISSDVPIFATSKAPIVYKGPYNVEDERETEMMNSRWRMIRFKHAFEEKDQKKVEPCGSCFARLVLLGEK
ncbi:Hypothetical predicted protein [Paramuricea clavata]|uniref:Uncharacterized protein n=1 Tax=Paramuricea clavata TaxID=317549 RepID=A0A6S7IMZ0_PARCT|nr:Hypothetical predicted protein [Paramuricea clavata]